MLEQGAFPAEQVRQRACRPCVSPRGWSRPEMSSGSFPEGGVAKGNQSVLRGRAIKRGVCTVAVEQVPVVPVVVLGTDTRLNRVGPWLPFRRGQVWIAFGDDVMRTPRSDSRRADRCRMTTRLHDLYGPISALKNRGA